MIELKEGAGLVVVGDVRNAVAAVDEALLNGARLCASVIEASQGANIPVQQSQVLLQAISQGMNRVVEGRSEFVIAIKQMAAIKGQSNLAPVDYGCPDGWPTTGSINSPMPKEQQERA